jgi:hypothetical protein
MTIRVKLSLETVSREGVSIEEKKWKKKRTGEVTRAPRGLT